MASLEHLDGDKWRTRTYVTDPLTRKRRLVSRSFIAKGKRAAERKHHQVAADLEREAERARKHGASFAGLVEDWLTIKARDCSPSTMIAYRRHAKRITDEFGHLPADGVTGQMIDRWYTRLMANGMTAANVQHVHRVLRAICRFGHRKRGLPTCPTDQATPPPAPTYEARPPTPAAVRALLCGVTGEWGRAVALLAYAGLRRGEVVGLRWDDIGPTVMLVQHSVVERPAAEVYVRETKRGRSRRVVLSADARRVLEEQRCQVEADAARGGRPVPAWVFPDWQQQGRLPHRPGWVSLMWGRYMRRMIEAGTLRPEHRVRLHGLRHMYASMLIDAGVPITSVSKQLGHAKTSTTTDIYGHADERTEDQIGAAIDRALGSGAPT